MTTPRNYAPTPWINAVHPVTEDHYKFRISYTRSMGKLTFTWHKDSMHASGEVRKVAPNRRNWWEFVQASRRLLHTSEWDPGTNPNSSIAVARWRTHMQDYATHQDDVLVVVAMLPQLLHPKHRPLRKLLADARKAAATQGGTHISQVAARSARLGEIVMAASKVESAVHGLYERMQDARKMKGYSKEEVQAMESVTGSIIQAAQTLARMARTNAPAETQTVLSKTPDAAPSTVIPAAGPRPLRRPVDVKVGFDLGDFEEGSTSPVQPDPNVPRMSIGQPQGPLDVPPEQWHLWVKNERGFWVLKGESEIPIGVE